MEHKTKHCPRKHKIKHRHGGIVEVGNYARSKAIKLFCTECMGWDSHPKDCTAPNCPLFPFRGKKQDAIRAKSGDRIPTTTP